MSQPKWRFVASIGDVDPVSYGGTLIFRDSTGVYCEEAASIQPSFDDDNNIYVYRFVLEKCTFINGVLSDNKFHPEHPAWFAKPESEKATRPQDSTYLSSPCSFCDVTYEDMVMRLCSDDPILRAMAYDDIGRYHGFENLDGYPLEMTAGQVRRKYRSALKQTRRVR